MGDLFEFFAKMMHQTFSKNMLHPIQEVLVNVLILSPTRDEIQKTLWRYDPHKGHVSIFVLQSGSLLVLLEELLRKSFVCTAEIPPEFSLEKLGVEFLLSELPALEFLSAWVTLSAQAGDPLLRVRKRMLICFHPVRELMRTPVPITYGSCCHQNLPDRTTVSCANCAK